MEFDIEFNEEKNLLLKATRGICFDDVIDALADDGYVDVLIHKNKNRYHNQRILVVKIKEYIYAVPFVINKDKNTIFLKTVYPDRRLTKIYLLK